MRTILFSIVLLLAGAGVTRAAVLPEHVLDTYAEIGLAGYQDALTAAHQLEVAIDALLAAPGEQTLKNARAAWIHARVPYQQVEVFRFGNRLADTREGRINAWPLDEAMIDYVAEALPYGAQQSANDNDGYVLNVIADRQLSVGGRIVDAGSITADLLSDVLREADDGADAITGYHAIEFLLWGQDLNGTGPAPADRVGTPQERHAGNRPYTDFDLEHCTGGQCERRRDYLKVVVQLLLCDLEDIVTSWQERGRARQALMRDPKQGLSAVLTGLGSLSYGELAGERMKLGLILHDAEREQDDFSDNTHNAHYYNQVGMMNVYNGRYTRSDGSAVSGPGLSDLVRARDAGLDQEMRGRLDQAYQALLAIKRRAETVETYDQMIGQGNVEGNALVQAAIDSLVAQARTIERIAFALELRDVHIEGSDSLDDPDSIVRQAPDRPAAHADR